MQIPNEFTIYRIEAAMTNNLNGKCHGERMVLNNDTSSHFIQNSSRGREMLITWIFIIQSLLLPL
jgi:hypothetical protein